MSGDNKPDEKDIENAFDAASKYSEKSELLEKLPNTFDQQSFDDIITSLNQLGFLHWYEEKLKNGKYLIEEAIWLSDTAKNHQLLDMMCKVPELKSSSAIASRALLFAGESAKWDVVLHIVDLLGEKISKDDFETVSENAIESNSWDVVLQLASLTKVLDKENLMIKAFKKAVWCCDFANATRLIPVDSNTSSFHQVLYDLLTKSASDGDNRLCDYLCKIVKEKNIQLEDRTLANILKANKYNNWMIGSSLRELQRTAKNNAAINNDQTLSNRNNTRDESLNNDPLSSDYEIFNRHETRDESLKNDQVFHITKEDLLMQILLKLEAHNYVLRGGGIKINGKTYAKSAGIIVNQIQSLLNNLDFTEANCESLLSNIKKELTGKTKSTKGSSFFGRGGRDKTTADLYSEILDLIDGYRNTASVRPN